MNSLGKADTEIKYSAVIVLSAIATFIFYWLTCFRTFTWWDSSEYSIAALTLGIPHPPGSLLTVMAGWIAAKLPLGVDKFFALNLLACLMASFTLYFVGRVSLGLFYQTAENDSFRIKGVPHGPAIATSLAMLFFGLSATMWHYAIRFTPYMTTALLTILILTAALAWQKRMNDPDSHIWLALVTLLFGLDFSVHRTNLLMLPGFLAWIAVIKPRTFLSIKHWIFGIAGLAIGLSVQFLLIPMAAGKPFINFNDPSSLSSFWDYITLKQYGGGWLINMFPRKAPFLNTQVADYIKVFGDNFARGPWPVIRFLPFVLGLAGVILLFKRNRKIALGLAVMFLFSSLGAISYFNLPENFFRSIDRHYMPSFVIFGIFIAYGAASLMLAVLEVQGRSRLAIVALAAILLTLMPIQAAVRNYRLVDGSRSYFAYDTAKNYLSNLPKDAVFLSQADIDTYPLWCLQIAENFRNDVAVCNISLMNTPWFVEQVIQRDDRFPVRMDRSELSALSIIPWHDSTITIPVNVRAEDYGFADSTLMPDSISFLVRPTLSGQYIFVHDQMALRIIAANNWQRPICISTLIPESTLNWLAPSLRLEGMFRRLVPARAAISDAEFLKHNLLENINYRGFADPSIPKEAPTKWVAWNLCGAFLALSAMESSMGDTTGCRNAIDQMNMMIAPINLSPPEGLATAIANACK
ncbi:MAG: hypothetical protein A2W25_00535 [candidate division Zixibacteria bacterium RBG_16_53_22]|nr:MAG: hypothetical protein A2W25_00535 [candidate division Zixibacteria bacterium RBG_16_53_22]